MPSSAALYNHDFVNLGPIADSWSAPETCANRIGMAYQGDPAYPALFEECEPPKYAECLPGGDELDKDTAKRWETHGLRPAIYYHQPASACPESWTTAGIAAKGADGKVSSSGVYVPTYTTLPDLNPTPNIFMEALKPGETAVVCCPSGYTANEGDWGEGCHSLMPMASYTKDTVCSTSANQRNLFETVTFTYDDKVVTGVVATEVGDAPTSRASRVTAVPRVSSVWQVATYTPAITLVHGGEAGPKPTEGSSKDDDKPTKTKEDPKPTESKEDPKPTESKEDPKPTESKDKPKTTTKDEEKPKTSATDTPEFITEEPTKTPGASADKPSSGFTTVKPSTDVAPTPSGAPQPGSTPGAGSGDGNGNGNGNGNGGGNGDSNGNGGKDDGPPEGAANMSWGNLNKIVATVWGLAAVSGMLIAAL